MCIIAFSLNEHPDYKLIIAANRDEFFERPSTYAGWWEDQPGIYGGRDLQAGGTWLGMTKSGKIAAVTNFRDPSNIRPDAKTRGTLALDYLKGETDAKSYLEALAKAADDYNGFNLLLFENDRAYHFSNYEHQLNEIAGGVHTLSNALLNTPWPKVTKLQKRFSQTIKEAFEADDLLGVLEDDAQAPDELLPSTGIPYEWEKAISSICIKTENYGTCCSTIITVDHSNCVRFTERSFPVGNRSDRTVSKEFIIEE